ncbi:uncharacterized protein N7503_005241 [Penicillium pulvis]|uniref:uncharacterized protein n=1 Tax=Penicillium pulvis TaxID=1562058 RepID=UPI0025479565|nr:uncharacterized protein N7503_005241 [Penicillium pulvis]KAJ5802791.1 hypothetical protein N7503_005241 [Penicillium pulvis]
MDLNPPFAIPDRISSLMSQGRRHAIHFRQARSISAASKVSAISQASVETTVSDFLEAKIESLASEKDYFKCVKEGLDEARTTGALNDTVFQEQLGPCLDQFRSSAKKLTVLKRQTRMLADDLEENVALKKQRHHAVLEEGLLERAYRDTIVPRVMAASKSKNPGPPFKPQDFKRNVNRFYGLDKICDPGDSYCHVLGIHLDAAAVKAAHIVPKSLSPEEVSYLFGDEDRELVRDDCRNALCLHRKVEELLDEGIISILPVPNAVGEFETPTTWKCVLLDLRSRNMSDTIVRKQDGDYYRLKDLDNRVLTFLSDNRPRRRYLYFRFLISYLNAKRLNIDFAPSKFDVRTFWPSQGPYLHKSTLKALARCVSGCEIPERLVDDNTFDEPADNSEAEEAGMILGSELRRLRSGRIENTESDSLRDAVLESLKIL